MRFIENIKVYLGDRAIRNHLKTGKRKMESCNIQNASSIGILFDATQQIAFEIVKNLVKDLEKNKVSIEVLGYVDSKQLIDAYLYRKGFDFFSRTQLNWYKKPVGENVETFISKSFDILLDLSTDHPYPIQYILACSAAKFKAGCYTSGQNHLDLMIDIEKEMANMGDINNELAKNEKSQKPKNKELEKIVAKKIQTEIQMNFLINQLLHYLSIIKK
jgi:hypothetical protein